MVDIVGSGLIEGTEEADNITGGEFSDQIYGYGGDDVIDAGEFADLVYGGDGNDIIYGGFGPDPSDAAQDSLYGEAGDDTIYGYDGRDLLDGGDGSDTLYGGDDTDRLQGGTGADTMYGGAGGDIFYVDDPDDLVIEYDGEGDNDIVFANITWTGGYRLPDFVERGFATNGGILRGNAMDNYLYSDGGALLVGSAGDDTYIITPTDAIAEVEGLGNDTVYVTFDYTLGANVENLRVGNGYGYAGVTLTGNELDNQITGSYLDDTLYGLDGNDTLAGDWGNDLIDGGAGVDTASYAYYVGAVTVSLALQGVAQDTGSAGFDTLFSIENLTGSDYDDTLTGDAGINRLEGGLGNDSLNGLAGNDVINGGEGGDTLAGGSGADSLFGGIGSDQLYGGRGADVLYGEGGADYMVGGKFDDVLYGGGGADKLVGGLGADIFAYASLTDAGQSQANSDIIADFDRAEGDLIDLSAIDADSTTAGNQAFTFIGDAAFSGTAGELRYFQGATRTIVEMDVDGDGSAEAFLRLDGLFDIGRADFATGSLIDALAAPGSAPAHLVADSFAFF